MGHPMRLVTFGTFDDIGGGASPARLAYWAGGGVAACGAGAICGGAIMVINCWTTIAPPWTSSAGTKATTLQAPWLMVAALPTVPVSWENMGAIICICGLLPIALAKHLPTS